MLIFLNGADDYQAKQTIKQLIAKYIAKNPDGSELIRTSVTDDNFAANWQRIVSDLKAIPLFATSRLIIIERIGKLDLKQQDDLAKNITDLPATTVVVLWDDQKLKSKELASALEKAKTFNAEPLTGAALISWIKKTAANFALKLNSQEISQLDNFWGSNLWGIETELQQLANSQMGLAKSETKTTDAPFVIFNYVRARNWQKVGSQILRDIESGKPLEMVLGGVGAAVRKEIKEPTARLKINEILIDVDMGIKTGSLDESGAALLLSYYLSNPDQKAVKWEDQWGEA